MEGQEKILALKGGVRAGKTHLWHMLLTLEALEHPGLMALVLRRDENDCTETTLHYVMNHPSNPRNWNRLGIVENSWNAPATVLLKNGSLIQFRGTVKKKKEKDDVGFGSTDYGLIIVEEAQEVDFEPYNFLLNRLSQNDPRDVPRRMILSFNPPYKSHWLFKEFGDHEPWKVDPETFRYVHNPNACPRCLEGTCDRRLVTFDIEHNRENQHEGYIEGLLQRYDADWVRRYLRGDWGVMKTGASVLPEFSESLHTAKFSLPVNPHYPLLIGWDAHIIGIYIGVVWAQCVGPRFHVLRSRLFRLGQDGSAREAVRSALRLTRLWFPNHVNSQTQHFGDPAMAVRERADMVSVSKILEDHGINLEYGDVSHVARREEMADWLSRRPGGQPAFLIDPNPDTDHLREGLGGGYCYPKRGEYIDKKGPEKNEYSHEVEAVQYVLTGMKILDWRRRKRQSEISERTRPAGTWMGS